MPRTARVSVGGLCYHVLNRGNGRAEVFHKDGDFAAFLQLMADANQRLPIRVLGYVLLPNHFHLVLWPRWMQWLLASHVRRYHRHYHGSGHVWQGRFIQLGKTQDGSKVRRALHIAKHRGSAASDEIVPFEITAQGLRLLYDRF